MTLLPLDTLRAAVGGDVFWDAQMQRIAEQAVGLHLAILVEPYLQFVLAGKKTIESRISRRRRPPWGEVYSDDIIAFKRSGGPIIGLGVVVRAQYECLTWGKLDELREQYGAALCVADSRWWEERRDASYATLLHLGRVRTVAPIAVTKRDQRAWIVLQQRTRRPQLWIPPAR